MLPNGVNGGSGHVVGVVALGVWWEGPANGCRTCTQWDLGALGFRGWGLLGIQGLGLLDLRRCWLIHGECAAQLISAPLLADAEPDSLVLPNSHR